MEIDPRRPRRLPAAFGGPGGFGGVADSLAGQVGAVVAGTLGGTPVPVVKGTATVTVLLPLVGPAEVAEVASALQAEFAPLGVRRSASTLDTLSALGSLSGRLEPSS